MEQDQIKEYAQMHIDMTQQLFGIVLTFDGKSIFLLDDLIQRAWPDQPPSLIDSVIITFGSFLGEAMIQTLGGQWVNTEQGWGVKIDNATAMVFTKVKKRLLNGMTDSISYYYEGIRAVVEKKLVI